MKQAICLLMLAFLTAGARAQEKKPVGVPRLAPDYKLDVLEWWAAHPFNAESRNYQPEISSPEPVVELKDGDCLQYAIEFLPRAGGTIKLAPGRYKPFRVIGRSNIHILGPEKGEAIITGSSRLAVHIDATDYGFWNHETATRPEPLKWHWLDRRLWEIHKVPTRNFYFKNIVFDGENVENDCSAMLIQRVFDVVFDNCTFRNFFRPDTDGYPGHGGLVNGHMGLNNIWFRKCNFVGKSVFVTYLDGAHGCGFLDCTMECANFLNPSPLFLTNHDYTYDLNENGKIEREEERNAKYIVVQGCTFKGDGNTCVQITGENILVRKNTCTGAMNSLAMVDEPGQIAHFSYPYGAVHTRILDNVVQGAVKRAWLVQGVPAGKQADAKALPEKDRFTVEGNKAANNPEKASMGGR